MSQRLPSAGCISYLKSTAGKLNRQVISIAARNSFVPAELAGSIRIRKCSIELPMLQEYCDRCGKKPVCENYTPGIEMGNKQST